MSDTTPTAAYILTKIDYIYAATVTYMLNLRRNITWEEQNII